MTKKLYGDFWLWCRQQWPIRNDWDMMQKWLPEGDYDEVKKLILEKDIDDMTVDERNEVYRIWNLFCEQLPQ